MQQSLGTVGQSVVIKGELSGKEDLIIEGQVEGKIELDDNTLTVGLHGQIRADVLAKTVIVLGTVKGNITATETINIRETATVEGELVAPRVGIAEGASVRGQIDVQPAPVSKVLVESKLEGTQVPPQPVGAVRH